MTLKTSRRTKLQSFLVTTWTTTRIRWSRSVSARNAYKLIASTSTYTTSEGRNTRRPYSAIPFLRTILSLLHTSRKSADTLSVVATDVEKSFPSWLRLCHVVSWRSRSTDLLRSDGMDKQLDEQQLSGRRAIPVAIITECPASPWRARRLHALTWKKRSFCFRCLSFLNRVSLRSAMSNEYNFLTRWPRHSLQ